MSDEIDIKISILSRVITIEGKSVRVEIYEDGEGGWLLEVVDEYYNSTVWSDSFDTEEEALDEALDALEKEGVDSFIGVETKVLH